MNYVAPVQPISDELKLKICDIVRQTFADYGLDLDTEEDADCVWFLLRYGCTVKEFNWADRQTTLQMQEWLSKQNNPQLLEKFNQDFQKELTYKENRSYMTIEEIKDAILRLKKEI